MGIHGSALPNVTPGPPVGCQDEHHHPNPSETLRSCDHRIHTPIPGMPPYFLARTLIRLKVSKHVPSGCLVSLIIRAATAA